jgi:hypothetical protein
MDMNLFRFLPVALLAVPAASHAFLWSQSVYDPITNYTYSATANFTQSGNQLKIVFTNTAAAAAPTNAQILTGLFWDLATSPTLVANSASITAGSSLVGGSLSGVYGDHWDFKTMAVTNQWGNAHYGIGASGLSGTFGSGDTFTGAGGSTGGVDYGIVPTAGYGATQTPFTQNSATFVLDLPVGYTLTASKISNVWMQYGSSPTEFYANVPEPASMAALGFGAIALLGKKRRKK